MSSKKALPKLLRIQQHELEVRKILVGRLQTRLNTLQEEDEQWAQSLQQEKKALTEDPQSGIAYIRYATLVDKKRMQINKLSSEITQQLEMEQDLLRQEFSQVRALEKYLTQEKEKEEKHQENKAQESLDERFAHKISNKNS